MRHHRLIKVRPYKAKKRPRWRFVVGYREAGKRKRTFFETKEQANNFAGFKNAELKRHGVEHAQFPERLRIMATNAVERLQPFGKTITQAVEHFVAYLEANERSRTAIELVKELLKAKEHDGASAVHLKDLRLRLGKFAEKFDGRNVSTITSTEIDDWLRSLTVAPITRNHYRRLIILAYNFALRRKYAASNPAVETDEAREPKSPPGILRVDQARALLVNTPREILPYIAIGLFAGLRRAELERLDWKEIDFESGLIEVTAKNAKTAQRRFVTIQPNLRKWLYRHRKLKGSVTPQENKVFRVLFDHARKAAGITQWPDNGLRHSFASYHMAHFKNAASTALELGHHDSRITFSHYRELVKPRDAERYWQISPAKTEKIVQMEERVA